MSSSPANDKPGDTSPPRQNPQCPTSKPAACSMDFRSKIECSMIMPTQRSLKDARLWLLRLAPATATGPRLRSSRETTKQTHRRASRGAESKKSRPILKGGCSFHQFKAGRRWLEVSSTTKRLMAEPLCCGPVARFHPVELFRPPISRD